MALLTAHCSTWTDTSTDKGMVYYFICTHFKFSITLQYTYGAWPSLVHCISWHFQIKTKYIAPDDISRQNEVSFGSRNAKHTSKNIVWPIHLLRSSRAKQVNGPQCSWMNGSCSQSFDRVVSNGDGDGGWASVWCSEVYPLGRLHISTWLTAHPPRAASWKRHRWASPGPPSSQTKLGLHCCRNTCSSGFHFY